MKRTVATSSGLKMRDYMMNPKGFTLIELLIVVAIIGILAAIAVPNFLNARTRAKASKAFSEVKMLYQANIAKKVDTNAWAIDGNDTGRPNMPETCYLKTPFWAQLTTPIAWISSVPKDPFEKNAAWPSGGIGEYNYGDSYCPNSTEGAYWVFWSAGPDGDKNDLAWGWEARATPYRPSNGLSSNGDIWIAHPVNGFSDRSIMHNLNMDNTFF